jgi:beta-phosphoglucomutase family hydrolase
MLKGVVFDMDGVLVDNMGVHMEAFAEIARRYGVEIDTAAVLAMAGKGNGEIFEALFPAEIVEQVGTERLGAEKEAIYREIYAPKLTPTPGLIAFLDGLKAVGIKIAVGTSAPRANMDFVFDGLGIRKYFDAVVNADMVSRCKPDPEIYLVALGELGIDAGECLVFEDAIAGIQAANAAGTGVVAVASTIPKSKLQIEPGVVLTIKDFTDITTKIAQTLLYGNM